jgi:hypothetical protein
MTLATERCRMACRTLTGESSSLLLMQLKLSKLPGRVMSVLLQRFCSYWHHLSLIHVCALGASAMMDGSHHDSFAISTGRSTSRTSAPPTTTTAS